MLLLSSLNSKVYNIIYVIDFLHKLCSQTMSYTVEQVYDEDCIARYIGFNRIVRCRMALL